MIFYEELKNSGSSGDYYLSWIKYSADALNSKLSQTTTPNQNDWPHDLEFPRVPIDLQKVINTIISQTIEFAGDSVDCIGISASSLLAAIPTLIQRGEYSLNFVCTVKFSHVSCTYMSHQSRVTFLNFIYLGVVE